MSNGVVSENSIELQRSHLPRVSKTSALCERGPERIVRKMSYSIEPCPGGAAIWPVDRPQTILTGHAELIIDRRHANEYRRNQIPLALNSDRQWVYGPPLFDPVTHYFNANSRPQFQPIGSYITSANNVLSG